MSEVFNHRKRLEEEAGLHKPGSRRLIRIEDMHDPVPDNLSEKEYRGIFSNHTDRPFFVPYAGFGLNAAHSYLDLFIRLSKLSNTHGSCIKSQDFLSFGGPIEIKGDRKRYVFQEEVEVSPGDQEAYVDLVSNYVPQLNPKQVMRQAFQWGKKTGDRYYLVEANALFAEIKVIDPRNVLYYVDPKVPYKVIAYGEGRMTEKMILEEDYLLIPVGPQLGEYSDGIKRTILHFKDGTNYWYGRPDAEQGMISIYGENKNDEFLLKSSANFFTGRAFLEMEDDPGRAGDSMDENAADAGFVGGFADQIDANMTNRAADPMSFTAMTRPFGSSPAVLLQMANNTPEGFHKFMMESSITKIVMAHNWSQKLLGIEMASGLSTNEYLDILKVKRIGVIKAYQDMISSELKEVIDVVGGIFGFANDMRFVPTCPFDEMIMEHKQMAEQIGQAKEDTTEEETDDDLENEE